MMFGQEGENVNANFAGRGDCTSTHLWLRTAESSQPEGLNLNSRRSAFFADLRKESKNSATLEGSNCQLHCSHRPDAHSPHRSITTSRLSSRNRELLAPEFDVGGFSVRQELTKPGGKR